MTVFRKHAKADDALKLFKLLGLPNMRWGQQRRNGKVWCCQKRRIDLQLAT
jgi:hypothetical protein